MNKSILSFTIIAVLLLLTGYNYYQKYYNDNEMQNRENIDNKRLNAFGNSLYNSGKIIADTQMIDAVTMKNEKIVFKKPTLIILLSDYGCSKCQNRELENINKYLLSVSNNKINIIAIGNKNSREVILKLKKVTQSSIPMYLDANADFINTYKMTEIFPQLIYVLDNRIIYTFLPIQEDDNYSKWFFDNIRRNNQFFND